MQATPQKTRLIIAILAVIVGLFLLVGATLLVQVSMERVLISLLEVSKEKPQYASGIALFSLFFPIWRALGFVAGITLLAIALPLYRGEEWSLPVALLCHAIPAVGGMFMFLPYISWVEGFPIPMSISWVGLAGFWGTLLLRQGDRLQKLGDFLVYTFIGMLATHSFTIGIGAQRMLLTRPEKPLFAGVEWWILTLAGEVNWIGTLMLLIAIPLLAMRKASGWWLALISALSILIVNTPTQIIRTRTLDYFYGALIAAGLLVWLSIPAFMERLLGQKP
ncbi:MAG: hypothetical protein PHD58_07585 [Anaerolineales bacterium]|nr:hypothetical protein [Anaerolineales bacterium]